MSTRPRKLVAAIAAAIACAAPVPATASAVDRGGDSAKPQQAKQQEPWQAAEQLTSSLFDAQSDLLLGTGGRGVADARAALSGPLGKTLAQSAPADLKDIRGALDEAAAAEASGDQAGLADARGRATAALRRASFAITLAAVNAGDAATANDWFLVRDFRQATKFTRPGIDGTEALKALASGDTSPKDAATEVKKDLLDAYQAQILAHLTEAVQADQRGFSSRRAETAELATGYWPIIRPEYVEQRDEESAARLDRAFDRLAAGSRSGGKEFQSAAKEVQAGLDGFTAAAFTAEEQARRANQLLRFVDLIPVEYEHGTDDGHVTREFELQEATAFLDASDAAFADLKGPLEERDAAGVQQVVAGLAQMRAIVTDAASGGEVASQDDIDGASDDAHDALERILPDDWKQSGDDADFDLIQISLDQMEAAAGAGEYDQAEQARLAAYSFLEFGPELKLKAFNTTLATEIEGLFWYGEGGHDGMAQLVADHAPVSAFRDSRVPLNEKLDDARGTLGEGASAATAITNSALIVFREGLEAILIMAAITASLIGPRRRLRRPILRGAALALPASIALFIAALTVIDSLSRYGEKLEAVVGLVAIAVLLLTLNWFFHRVYWTEWISSHRQRGKKLATGAVAAGGAATTTILGLYLLGFTSVFREGFETVLFLQAVQLSSGTGVVVAGSALGLALTLGVGAATFALERRLPYKKLLIVTGILISVVLMVMVGTTVRVMQGVGWLPISPIHAEFPLWMGTWLGIFPTWETLAGQGAALAFVLGSYFLAEYVRKRNIRRAVARTEAADDEAAGTANGNGAKKPGLDPDAPRIDAPKTDRGDRITSSS